jgi:predicted metalloprotease with PDZ domain
LIQVIREAESFARASRITGLAVQILLVFLALGRISLGQCAFTDHGPGTPVRYFFDPIITSGKTTMRITLEFQGSRDGKAELEVPTSYAGQTDLDKSFLDLKALSQQTTIADTALPSRKKVHFLPNTPVRISYVLVKDWDGPLDSGTRFRPILEPNYFQLLADTALIKPVLKGTALVDAQFIWEHLPSGWSLATSFATGDSCQHFRGLWYKVRTALFVGGDYRIYHTSVLGKPLNFAIRGKWIFTDQEWIDCVQQIIASERTFWHDNDFPYYLVTLAPFDQQGGSTGGSTYTDAFMMHLSRNGSLSYVTLSILAHETFHIWNPYKMGRGRGEALYWFTEGFTVYYTDRMLFRSGMLSFPEYVERTNEKLREYELSPSKNISSRELNARYEKDRSLNHVPYERGMMVAQWLDWRIREHSGNRVSLDAIIFELVRHAKDAKFQLTNHGLLRIAGKYLARRDRHLLRRFVQDGETIPVPESALGPCVHVETDAIAQFELGMDREMLMNKHIVANVKPGSEAFKAGLRDGQKIIRTSVTWNDTSKLIKLTVRAADGDHPFEYYPRGPLRNIPQFHLDQSYSPNTPGCSATLQSVEQKVTK